MRLYLDLWKHRIKTRVLVDYKIRCIDIAETQRQRARIISKYSYLFSPVNSIGYLMNAIRLRQDFSVRAMQCGTTWIFNTIHTV
jgi:hypothetical protein